MTTKTQYIAQARAANPQPQYRTVNGEKIQLNEEEYETSIEAWAEMKTQQDAHLATLEAEAAAKASARSKLTALGLTDEEIAALLA